MGLSEALHDGVRVRFWRLASCAALFGLLMSMPSGVATGADAEQGYQHLLTRPYDAPFMTETMLWDVWKVWPEPARTEVEQASPAERRKMIFTRYGLVEEQGRDLPISLVRTPGGGLAVTCLACHGGKVAGRYIPGLGNSNMAGDALASDLALLMHRENLARLAGTVDWPAGFPIPQSVNAVGVNNAFGDSPILLAMRDKDLNLQALPQYPLPPASLFIPDKTPPWWGTKRKKFLYWDGFVQTSVREGTMQFAATPANSAEAIKSFEPDFNDIYAWILSLKAPQYPWPIDKALAARGLGIFINNCARCHGSYGPGGKYPETTVELREIGTDPLRFEAFSRDFRQHLGEGWFGEYGKIKTILDPKGYVAPPLDGVWATAPYLHNGSVPTLADLLNPDQRPKAWRRTPDGYDQQKVGIEVETLAEAPNSTGPGVVRDYYDTSLPGLGNGGHRFPSKPLSERDQKALLEYLKTL
jgi:mono/diheme cytochrome c family protein